MFVPRPEFVKEEREKETFALLTVSGNSAIQLAHFDVIVVDALRQLFEPLQSSHRQIPDQSLFEYTLSSKPWSNPSSPDTQSLFLSILSLIFAHGYSLLSPIDYAREPHDKIAILFSKPSHPAPRHVPFALSFPDKYTLRVIHPPLHSTPAILQALRSAWPRGIASENKLQNNSYEFKLKGYSSKSSFSFYYTFLSSLQFSEKTLLQKTP